MGDWTDMPFADEIKGSRRTECDRCTGAPCRQIRAQPDPEGLER